MTKTDWLAFAITAALMMVCHERHWTFWEGAFAVLAGTSLRPLLGWPSAR